MPVHDLAPQTIGATLMDACRRWPDRPAFRLGHRQANYDVFWQEVIGCSRALIALGVRPGHNIGLYLPNCWEYAVLFYAIGIAGACTVALNARFREQDLRYALKKADISVLFTASGAGGRPVLERALPGLDGWRYPQPLALADAPALTLVIDLAAKEDDGWLGWQAFLARAGDVDDTVLADRLKSVAAAQDCLIMFSSGTTAHPKACRLSHRALTISGEGMAQRFHLTPADRFWDPLPFFHMSTILPMTACHLTGACFIGVAHFEPGRALEEMEQTRATIGYPAFSTITTALISHADFRTRDLSALRLILNVGPADLLRRFQAAFPQAVQISCYGLTECGGLSFYNEPSENLEQRVTTSGHPVAGVEVRVADDNGLVAKSGSRGEIQLRGLTLFSGYYGDDALTEQAMTADGWLRTGDIGSLDADGRLCYAGRLKDMLRVGGENVAAAEIESYLVTHPAIRLAQVVGVPDDRLDEVPAAFIELEDGAGLEESEVVRFCAGQIANFKIPRYVRFVREWPMSATKIQKFQLKDDFVPERKIDLAQLLREASAADAG